MSRREFHALDQNCESLPEAARADGVPRRGAVSRPHARASHRRVPLRGGVRRSFDAVPNSRLNSIIVQPASSQGSRLSQRPADHASLSSRLVIYPDHFEARLNGRRLKLTPVEFRLLRMLATDAGRLYSRDQLLNHIYPDFRVVSDRTVDSHIKNLRIKLKQVAPGQSIIQAVYGMGYRLDL